MAANNNRGTLSYHTWTSLICNICKQYFGNTIKKGLIFAFADDTVAGYQDKSWSKVQQKLQLFFRKIKE